MDADNIEYKKSPAGTSVGGSVLGTPEAKAVNAPEKRQELYAKRVKVFPRRVYGTFRMIKWVVMSISLTIYYALPWVRWDRGHDVPSQAVLFDFPTRKGYIFDIEIWAQEVYYATGLLILAAFILFLMTSVAGRIWCGYACPQTVWTDLFVHIERWVEGDRNQRIKLDKAKWSFGKITKRVIKHILWMIVAVLTGGAFVFYFADAPTLAPQLVMGTAPMTSYLFILALAGTTYLLGGIAREQVCTYMCPWPRIQGALIDDHTMLVSYNKHRGEPRGKHKKAETWDGRGDCISCKQCVAVCPMGIDIRDGFQLECIQCALCIDACNSIMKKIDRPKNLISYVSHHQEAAGGKKLQKTEVFRPRTIIYLVLIGLVSAIMLGSLFTRADIDINVLKDRNPLYVMLSDGRLRNGYTMNLMNKVHAMRPVTISIEGLDGAMMRTAFSEESQTLTTILSPDMLKSLKIFVVVPKDKGLDRHSFSFIITEKDGTKLLEEDTSFNGPRK